MRSAAYLLLLPALTASCVIELGDWGGVKASKNVDLDFKPSAPITEILVDTYNGGVAIEVGAGGGITGSSKVWASGSTQARADERLTTMNWTFTEEGNGRVVLKMGQPATGRSNNAGANATLKVPAGVRLLVDTSNGEVEIHGAFPYTWVDTSNGPITVHGAKDVVADTSNGSVDVQANGKVVIDTSNGGVTFSGSSTDFAIDSSNGNVEVNLDGDWSGQASVDTSNGNITLHCAGILKCALDSETSNGKLHVEGPALANAGGKLVLETSNGEIWVKHGGK